MSDSETVPFPFKRLKSRAPSQTLLGYGGEGHIEDECRVWGDLGRRSLLAVAQFGWDHKHPPATFLHAGNALVPSLDHLPCVDGESKLVCRVKHCTVLEPPLILHRNGIARPCSLALSFPLLLDLHSHVWWWCVNFSWNHVTTLVLDQGSISHCLFEHSKQPGVLLKLVLGLEVFLYGCKACASGALQGANPLEHFIKNLRHGGDVKREPSITVARFLDSEGFQKGRYQYETSGLGDWSWHVSLIPRPRDS
mmetsp:Transcript_45724/g.111336  ORF Transcript_45724/g.111336 Transcript_45724/m.111336 type:complete len:251 (+) Transcript_45724:1113-1865(+)